MNFKSLLFSGALLCGFASCEDALEENHSLLLNSSSKSVETKGVDAVSDYFILQLSYKGIDYVVNCEQRNDSIIYLNEEFRELYENEISKLPNLVTVVTTDGFVKFFDSKEEVLATTGLSISFDKGNLINLNADDTGMLGKLTLWDDKHFSNQKDVRTFWASATTIVSRAQLKDKPDEFNDKTSAISIEYLGDDEKLCAVLVAYENDQHTGRSLICIATKDNKHSDPDLDNVPCGKGTWSDRITSFTFSIENVGKYTESPHTN